MVISTERCLEHGHVCYGSSSPNGLAGLGEAAAASLLAGARNR